VVADSRVTDLPDSQVYLDVEEGDGGDGNDAKDQEVGRVV